jgi:tyrosyl-tRNA synthetase
LKEIEIASSQEGIVAVLRAAGLASSSSEAARKIGERAVRVDGVVVEDRAVTLSIGVEYLLQVGKRTFCRVRLKSSRG